MPKCERCEIVYPEECCSSLLMPAGRRFVCGICALEITNIVHGTRFRKFHGEEAERFRQNSLEWRKTHAS